MQVEPSGKAESGGLKVGDVLFSINKVPLSGSRDEAIHLVKMSPYTLTLQVERFKLYTLNTIHYYFNVTIIDQ